jgi:hypothetical protein
MSRGSVPEIQEQQQQQLVLEDEDRQQELQQKDRRARKEAATEATQTEDGETAQEGVLLESEQARAEAEASSKESEKKKKKDDDSGVDPSLGLLNIGPVQLQRDLEQPVTSGGMNTSIEDPGRRD